MKRLLSLITTLVMMVGMFTTFTPAAQAESSDPLPVQCTSAGIRTALDSGNQGLRFYQTLKTTLQNGKETVRYQGQDLEVVSVSVLTATLDTLTDARVHPDDLTVDLVGNVDKVVQTPVTKCRSRVQSGNDITYVFTALITGVTQQQKATDVCSRAHLLCKDANGNTVDVYGNVQITNVKEMYNAIGQNKFNSAIQLWMQGRNNNLLFDIVNASSVSKISPQTNTNYAFSTVDGQTSVLVTPTEDGIKEGGTIAVTFPAPDSLTQYPIVAMRIKLQRADSQFGRFFWRTQESERMWHVMNDMGARINWQQSINGLSLTYKPTTDWQVVYIDTSKVHNPYFIGNWTAVMFNLLPTFGGAGVTKDRGIYVDWIGAFGTIEDAYAFGGETMPEIEEEKPLTAVEQNGKDNAWQINNVLSSEMTKINVETSLVSNYQSRFAFKHHPSLVYFKGRWYAGFSRGVKDEDAPGQKMMVSTSTDFVNWTSPITVVEPASASMGTTNQLSGVGDLNSLGIVSTQIIGEFSVVGDTLCYYYSVTEFERSSFDADGNFLGMQDAKYQIRRQYAMYSKEGMKDDGTIEWTTPVLVTGINRYSEFIQSPYGSKKFFSISGFRIHYSLTEPQDPTQYITSSMMTAEQVVASRARCPGELTETSFYQGPDGVLHLLCRSETGYIWAATSMDEGMSWSEFYPTNFTSASTMFKTIVLPDGRIAWIGSPYYDVRLPLALYVSEDGYNFDKAYILQDEKYELQKEGWAKGGYYGYPQLVIEGDYLYILYTKQKEVVEICRVKLSDIK